MLCLKSPKSVPGRTFRRNSYASISRALMAEYLVIHFIKAGNLKLINKYRHRLTYTTGSGMDKVRICSFRFSSDAKHLKKAEKKERGWLTVQRSLIFIIFVFVSSSLAPNPKTPNEPFPIETKTFLEFKNLREFGLQSADQVTKQTPS